MNKKYQKEDILQKGETLLIQQGYHSTGINDVLEACGIPKGSFYNFFENKEDFGAQVIGRYGKKHAAHARAVLSDGTHTPIARLRHFYELAYESHAAKESRQGCLLSNSTTELSSESERCREVIVQAREETIQLIADCIAEGQAAGEITTMYDAQKLAQYLFFSYDGALVAMQATKSPEPIRVFIDITFAMITTK